MKNILTTENTSIHQVMKKLQKTGEKCLVVASKNKKLLGTITDGDIRRAILKKIKITSSIKKIYKKNCIYIFNKKKEIKSKKIFKLLKSKKINLIPIVNKSKRFIDYITPEKFHGSEKYKRINVEVIIMAGGAGTRLKPFTNVLPKPLIPLGNKTVIERIISNFTKYGVKRFIISINFKSKVIKSFFDELEPNYSYNFLEEKKPLGTVGCLAFLKSKKKKNYFITNCDTLMNVDCSEIYNFHTRNQNDITVVVSSKKFVVPYGSCKIDKAGLLEGIVEKPHQHLLVNTGMYVVNNQLFKLIQKNKFMNFVDLINISKKQGKKIGAFPVSDSAWFDTGQWDEYNKTLKFYDKQ